MQSKGKPAAKELFQIALTYDKAAARRIQVALMQVDALQWMLPYCKEKNRKGSFISHLYQFVESRLTLHVRKELERDGATVLL
jgi:hypothetical protein